MLNNCTEVHRGTVLLRLHRGTVLLCWELIAQEDDPFVLTLQGSMGKEI